MDTGIFTGAFAQQASDITTNSVTQAAQAQNISVDSVLVSIKQVQDAYKAENEKREIINYKPGFQWVKFRVAYNGIAQHSNEVTAILNAYKLYEQNKRIRQARVSI